MCVLFVLPVPARDFFFSFLLTPDGEEDREQMAELSAAPTAKRPCQCCCQTYSEILSFLEKRSEAEQRLREEELALRREELEIQRSTGILLLLGQIGVDSGVADGCAAFVVSLIEHHFNFR